MPPKKRQPWVFDPLLGFLEEFVNGNAGLVLAQSASLGHEIEKPIYQNLKAATSRAAQFDLVRASVDQAEKLFVETARKISKETLMSIARRTPAVYLAGSDLLLATLIANHAISRPGASYEVKMTGQQQGLGLLYTKDEFDTTLGLIAIAKHISRLAVMARLIGKGGKLTLRGSQLAVDVPDDVRRSVESYESRRPRTAFDSNGFFAPQPDYKQWSGYRIPTFLVFGDGMWFEAPKGSDRWLLFEKWPHQLDGSALMRLLRGYDEALKESWGVGADHIIHFLTALATLIYYSSPEIVASEGQEGAFDATEDFEHKLGFTFGLACKGFLRFPRSELVRNIGRVTTAFAPDPATGERLAEEFIDAFLFKPTPTEKSDYSSERRAPFLHASTGSQIYIDVLLTWDFLSGVLEQGKEWYASQHGDRFVLDLKRWLDVEAPNSVVGSRRPVRLLDAAASSDIDLLVKGPSGLLVVECKAYSKSPSYMMGSPDAVTERRGRIRQAVRQADRIAEAFRSAVLVGDTEFAPATAVQAVICMPSVEFLFPVEEFGMLKEGIPRVLTPEELLQFIATAHAL